MFSCLLIVNRLPAGDASAGANGQNIQEVYNKLLQLQDDMNALSETANKLATDREGRQDSIDVKNKFLLIYESKIFHWKLLLF